MANAQQSHERINAAEVYDFRDGEMWLSDRPGIGVVVNRVTKIAEYDEYRAVMPMHSCPVGSFTIEIRVPQVGTSAVR